ncbi:MAG: toll/interleukin-1 receptor domain-containing protein [Nibricoccus sp.]
MSTKIRRLANGSRECSLRFEPVGVDSIFAVLDAIAWIGQASLKKITQFADIDPRTAGKVIKNCLTLRLIEEIGDAYTLRLPYPYKGEREQKEAVLKESLFKLPLIIHTRQFLSLGDNHSIAVRKAATMIGVENYVENAIAPLLKWALELKALDPHIGVEDLVDAAAKQKETRHEKDAKKVVAFLSHSSKDKPFVRQLASDLVAVGVEVWLDEQRILVGDSITEKIGQGLAQSDYFIIALSEASVGSTWVQKELSGALISEVERRNVVVLPLKISECEIPTLLKDKKYADFSKSYKDGLRELVETLKRK